MPRCPYCNALGDDTLAHRINGCKQNMQWQTRRHNNIQNIILGYMKERLDKNMNHRTNITVNLEGKHLEDNNVKDLKPDIVSWDKNGIILVEFNCVYANTGRDGNKLDNAYENKTKKYDDLVKACKKLYKRKVTLYVIIVSSLGAIHKKSQQDIKNLLRIAPKETKLCSTIFRRLSLTACIGSYFIFNKLKFKEYIPDVKDTTNEVEIRDDIVNIEAVEQHQQQIHEQEEEDQEDSTDIEDNTSIGPSDTFDNNEEDVDDNEEDNSETEDEETGTSGTNNNGDHIADAGHNSSEDENEDEDTQVQEDGNTDGSSNREEEDRTSANTANQNDIT